MDKYFFQTSFLKVRYVFLKVGFKMEGFLFRLQVYKACKLIEVLHVV